MNSMTGYGRGESARHGYKLTVEMSSVNRKQSEIVLNLPRELDPLEARIRDRINQRVARGRLAVRVLLQAAEGNGNRRIRLNVPLARAYARELSKLERALRLPGTVTLDTLLRIPGVVETSSELDDSEAHWPALAAALDQALEGLLRMRAQEGAHLARDLCHRVRTMRKLARRVQRQAPGVARRFQAQLVERIREAGLPAPALDDERLLKEVVLFADRADITEELTRLQSHFQQFDQCAASTEPVGRVLDFLAQEMNREVNTIGSKANDSLISNAVVQLKAELERFREQVQNLE